jgi:hypothetical protein
VSSVVDKSALGQGFNQYFCFTLSLIFRQFYFPISKHCFYQTEEELAKLGNLEQNNASGFRKKKK